MHARLACGTYHSCSQNLLKLGLWACVALVKFRPKQERSFHAQSKPKSLVAVRTRTLCSVSRKYPSSK